MGNALDYSLMRVYVEGMSLQTTDRVIEALRKACDGAGSQAAWASQNKISTAYVSDTLNGRRDPGDAILDALGFERVTLYRKKASK